jgi:hypothetical protein
VVVGVVVPGDPPPELGLLVVVAVRRPVVVVATRPPPEPKAPEKTPVLGNPAKARAVVEVLGVPKAGGRGGAGLAGDDGRLGRKPGAEAIAAGAAAALGRDEGDGKGDQDECRKLGYPDLPAHLPALDDRRQIRSSSPTRPNPLAASRAQAGARRAAA